MDNMGLPDNEQNEQDRSLHHQICQYQDLQYRSNTEVCEDCLTRRDTSSLDVSKAFAATKEIYSENARNAQNEKNMEFKEKSEVTKLDIKSETRTSRTACSPDQIILKNSTCPEITVNQFRDEQAQGNRIPSNGAVFSIQDNENFQKNLQSNFCNKSIQADLLSSQCGYKESSSRNLDFRICEGGNLYSPLNSEALCEQSGRSVSTVGIPVLLDGMVQKTLLSKFLKTGHITDSLHHAIMKILSKFFELNCIPKPDMDFLGAKLSCHLKKYFSAKDPLNLGLKKCLNDLLVESIHEVYFLEEIPLTLSSRELLQSRIELVPLEMDFEGNQAENYAQHQSQNNLSEPTESEMYFQEQENNQVHFQTQYNSSEAIPREAHLPAPFQAGNQTQFHTILGQNQENIATQPQIVHQSYYESLMTQHIQPHPSLYYPASFQPPPDVLPFQPSHYSVQNQPAWLPSSQLFPYYWVPLQTSSYHSSQFHTLPYNLTPHLPSPHLVTLHPALYDPKHLPAPHHLPSFQQSPYTPSGVPLQHPPQFQQYQLPVPIPSVNHPPQYQQFSPWPQLPLYSSAVQIQPEMYSEHLRPMEFSPYSSFSEDSMEDYS